MSVKKNLMLWVAIFALALPLLLAGTASAMYMGDGAVQNGTTGGWVTPNDMMCIVGVHTDGTVDVADSVTNARDCIYLQTGTMNVGTAFDLSTMSTVSACTIVGFAGNDGAKHSWATSFCSKSLKGLDRTQQMCQGIGGTWVTTGKCVAYGRQFKGQDANGAPLAIGTKGTAAATAGYCYASMDWTAVYPTASCPSLGATVAPFNASAAYDWSVASSQCRYAKSIAGKLASALTKADGTTTAAGTYIDLSTFTTMGDCLANGGSWNNWVGTSTTTSAVGTDSNTYKRPNWDYTRQAPDADNGCLHCHSSLTEYNGPAEREKDSYLKTGHKNMLRKVTAGKNWAGPDANGIMQIYTASAVGAIDFTLATANTPTLYPLLYLFGDWMAPAPGGLDVVVNVSGAAKYNGTSDYSCAACHTAGWSNTTGTAGLCNYSSKTTSALCTAVASGAFGAGVWTPLSGVQAIGTPGYAAKQPGDSFPGITFGAAGQWDDDGITCGRCHNAAVAPVTAAQIAASAFPATQPTGGGMGALAAGVFRNNLCFGCHQSMAKTSNGIGTDADLSNPTALIVKNTATSPAYVPGFSGHVLGNSFLNSPHARFTGAVKPNSLGKYDLVGSLTSTVITAAANYNSTFRGYVCMQSASSSSPAKTQANGTEIKDKTTCETLYGAGAWRADTGSTSDVNGIQGTCATCHDVHQSLFVAGQEGMRKECDSCHNNTDFAAAVPGTFQATTINHPTSAGTPAGIDPEDPCVVCHMPKPTSGDFPMHVWRINSDAAYSTFPTSTEFGIGATATKKNANTATDSKGYTNAVWVDVDLACGQCHGGSGGTGATKNGAPYFTKAALAQGAAQMHNSGYVPPVGTTPVVSHGTVTQTGYSVSFTDTSTDTGDTSKLDAVTVNWGDGATSTGIRGGIFSHTYTGRARNVSIVHMVRNSADHTLYSKETLKLTVPVRYKVTGIVFQSNGTTAITSASVYLKQSNHTRQMVKSDATTGAFSFTNVLPGSYTIYVYKSGVTFGAAVPVTVTAADATQNITATNP